MHPLVFITGRAWFPKNTLYFQRMLLMDRTMSYVSMSEYMPIPSNIHLGWDRFTYLEVGFEDTFREGKLIEEVVFGEKFFIYEEQGNYHGVDLVNLATDEAEFHGCSTAIIGPINPSMQTFDSSTGMPDVPVRGRYLVPSAGSFFNLPAIPPTFRPGRLASTEKLETGLGIVLLKNCQKHKSLIH
jgi:hypothetical protein